MAECNHDCANCSANCGERTAPMLAEVHPRTNIKKIIAVTSGKGGVGKSSVTSMLAVLMNNLGYSVGILDADITGPSIPKAFGIEPGNVYGEDNAMIPNESRTGIKVMSLNLLVKDETEPVAWRGPVISGAVKQFYSETIWEDVDYLFIDMPPGTGDVSLTVFQSIPLDGILVVTSPQDLVSMVVKKAMHLAEKMNIPILGLIENYSYFTCPDCGKKINIFGESKINYVADEFDLDVLARLPISPKLANLIDRGLIEEFNTEELVLVTKVLEDMLDEDVDFDCGCGCGCEDCDECEDCEEYQREHECCCQGHDENHECCCHDHDEDNHECGCGCCSNSHEDDEEDDCSSCHEHDCSCNCH